MKTAIYMEHGLTQVVLTPETEWEKQALAGLKEDQTIEIKRGQFYHTQGGYERRGGGEESVMLRIYTQCLP